MSGDILRIAFHKPVKAGQDVSEYFTPSRVRIEELPDGGVVLRPLKADAWEEAVPVSPGSAETRMVKYIVEVERSGIAWRARVIADLPASAIAGKEPPPEYAPVVGVVKQRGKGTGK